jgi:peptidylglycine monooxygenase
MTSRSAGGSLLLGDRRYVAERAWGRLPAGMAWGQVSRLAIDSADRVYVLQRADPPVHVFAPDGTYLSSLGHGQARDGHGICICGDRLYLTDRDAHRILIFELSGRLLSKIGADYVASFGEPFNHPTEIAIAPDGEMYVTDGYANSRVHRFRADGSHMASWGTFGRGRGEFFVPHSVVIDDMNRVVVADRENGRIQLFDRDGAWLDEWTPFSCPTDVFQDRRGNFYITDMLSRLCMHDRDGVMVGCCRPVQRSAHGVEVDSQGNVYLAEVIPSQVTKLTVTS